MEKQQTEQVRRISEMEAILDASAAAVSAAGTAMAQLRKQLPDLHRLMMYYESDEWRQDFAADHAGSLPHDLKRGVLSEDAVFDLLTDYMQLIDMLAEIADGEVRE